MSKQVTRHTKSLKSKGKTHKVTDLGSGVYNVTSGSSGNVYRVCVGQHGQGSSCDCDWGKYRKRGQAAACSHTLSVYAHMAAQEAASVSAWANESDAKRQHKHIIRDLASDGVLLTERR